MKKILIILLLLISTNLMSEEQNSISKEEAYNIALKVSGFNNKDRQYTKSLANEIKQVKISKDSILIWGEEVNDRDVYIVPIKDVELSLDGWTEKAHMDQNKKTFSFYIDSKTSQVIKITAQTDTTASFFQDKIIKANMKTKLYSGGLEEWLGFPDSLPKISLQEALLSAVPSSPLLAKDLYCTCVYYKILDHEPRLVWQIIGSDIPEDFLGKRVKTTVDATTGQLISASRY